MKHLRNFRQITWTNMSRAEDETGLEEGKSVCKLLRSSRCYWRRVSIQKGGVRRGRDNEKAQDLEEQMNGEVIPWFRLPWLLSWIATNLVPENNTDLLSYGSGGQKSKFILSGLKSRGWLDNVFSGVCVCVCVCVCVYAQSSPSLCGPMDCSLPVSSVHGILQARILE